MDLVAELWSELVYKGVVINGDFGDVFVKTWKETNEKRLKLIGG